MKKQKSATSRKELKHKMAVVFRQDIEILPKDFREILVDDLVTALENRLNILTKVNQNTHFVTLTTESAECETFQT